jgi:hypothetical protein
MCGGLAGAAVGATRDPAPKQKTAAQKKDQMVHELLELLENTKSIDTFVMTAHVLLDVNADAHVLVPALLRNADRLHVCTKRDSGREMMGAMLDAAMADIRDRGQYGPPLPAMPPFPPALLSPWSPSPTWAPALPDMRHLPINAVWYQLMQQGFAPGLEMPEAMLPPPRAGGAPMLCPPTAINEDAAARPAERPAQRTPACSPVAPCGSRW